MEPGAATEPPTAPAGPRRPAVSARWARLGDLGPLVRLYRDQPPESREFFHPYPFDRARLVPLLLLLLISSRGVRLMLRLAPNYAFVVLVAEERTGAPPAAIGTARFVRHGAEPIWAQFGYLVRADLQGHGVGSYLALALWRTAVGLGVHRGGGTVLEGNVASARVVEPFGFRLAPTDRTDVRSGNRQNLGSVQDLDAVLEQVERRGGWRAEALHDEIRR
jgi:RimJ/RimL family protein N-acetyltransferase